MDGGDRAGDDVCAVSGLLGGGLVAQRQVESSCAAGEPESVWLAFLVADETEVVARAVQQVEAAEAVVEGAVVEAVVEVVVRGAESAVAALSFACVHALLEPGTTSMRERCAREGL